MFHTLIKWIIDERNSKRVISVRLIQNLDKKNTNCC